MMLIGLTFAAAVAAQPEISVMPPPEESRAQRTGVPLDLAQAWRLALDEDPVLKAQGARRDARRETQAQARGALLPQVGVQAYREDVSSDGERIGLTPSGDIGMVSTRTDSDTDFIGVNARQPLLAVDRWIALRQAGDVRTAAELEYALAREDLALRVANAYFAVLTAREAHAVATAHLNAVERFADQIGHRYDAGVVANTDVQEARAALDTATADRIDARHRVRVAEQALANLVGVRPGPLRGVAPSLRAEPPQPADESWWVERARTESTVVLLAQTGTDIARREVQRRRAAHYPTIDLVAGRARTDRASTNPFEAMDVDGNTVRVELNMPLFAGGAIRSRVREAAAEQRESEFLLDDVRRGSELRAREAWLGVEAAAQRIRARDQAQRSAQAALSGAEVGAVEGVRTTADVLDAQRLVAQTRAAASQARFDYLVAVLRLRAAAGLLDDEAMETVNGWLE